MSIFEVEKQVTQEILKLEKMIDNIYIERNNCINDPESSIYKNRFHSRMEFLHDNLVNCHDYLYIEKQKLKNIKNLKVFHYSTFTFQNYTLNYY